MSNLTFMNAKTGTKSKILRSKDRESEDDAKKRLEAIGWEVNSFTFDKKRKIFFKK